VDVSSGEEPSRQKDSASEVPEDVDTPVRALITLRDPDAAVLVSPSMLADVPVTSSDSREPIIATLITSSLQVGPSTILTTTGFPARETLLPEPTVVSSAVAPSSKEVTPPASSPVVNVPPSEGMHLQEPTASSSAVAASLSRQVCFTP
jgi:hypothetical protein